MNEVALKKKKPFGFYVCCIAFMFERMAYYSAKYLIYAFLSAAVLVGGMGLTVGETAIIQSNLVAYTYLAPIFGGYLSDKYIGARYCVPVGLLLMAAGYYVGGTATTVGTMNIMVALVAIGTGLFKGNVAAISGALFDDPKELDSAFSLQYSFVNIGALIGTLAVGILITQTFLQGDIQGFRPSFKLCGIICVIDCIWFLYGTKFFGEVGKKPFKEGKHVEKQVKTETKPLTKLEKKKVFAIVLISLFSVIFWVFWYLTYVAVYDYAGKFVQMSIGDFAVPLSWFDSLNSFMCIALGPVLGVLWLKLSKRPQGDLSLFKKLGIGLGFLGLSFFMLVFAEMSRGGDVTAKASILWIVAFGILLSTGEMLFSPLGNSFVTKYAPNKIYSVLLGVWIFAIFIAGKSYGYLYAFASKFPIMQAYIAIPMILFVFAIILFVSDKKLMTLLEDDGSDSKECKEIV